MHYTKHNGQFFDGSINYETEPIIKGNSISFKITLYPESKHTLDQITAAKQWLYYNYNIKNIKIIRQDGLKVEK